jgi:hypothetical protein
MPDYTSPKETGGAGVHFENLIAAYILSCMLSGKTFDTRFEPPARIDFQNNGRDWLDIDDLLVTVRKKEGDERPPPRIALSIKSNQQIKGDKFPAEFVKTSWELLLGSKSSFDIARDYLGLISPAMVDSTRIQWQTLSDWSRKQDESDLKGQIFSTGNVKMQTLYESFACPISSAFLQSDNELEQAKLLSRIVVFSWDFNNSSGTQSILALDNCSSVVENPQDAVLLWDKLIVLSQNYKQSSGTLTQSKLIGELSESIKLKSPELLLAKQEAELCYSLKMSEERCLRSWELLGLSEAHAKTLLDEEVVEEHISEYLPTNEAPLNIITAPLGYGKTLLAERVFQHLVKSKIDDQNCIMPILWSAKRIYDSVLEETKKLVQSNWLTDKSYLIIIDSLDEIDSNLAKKIILDCKTSIQIHSTYEIRFLIFSRPLTLFEDVAFKALSQKELPPLSEEEIDTLFEKITGRDRGWYYHEGSMAVLEAIQSPLFTILAAVYVRDNEIYGSPSPIELINYWIEKKLAIIDSRFNHSRNNLTSLAYYVLNSPTSEVDRVLLEEKIVVDEVVKSGLVKSTGSKFTFALRILAEWFGAQYVHREILCTRPLNLKMEQLDKWLPSFRLFIQSANHDEIKTLFEYLLSISPTFCFKMFIGFKSYNKRDDESERDSFSQYELAKSLRESMTAWTKAFGSKLSAIIAPVDSKGELNPLGVSSKPLMGSLISDKVNTGSYAWCYRNPSFFNGEIFDLEKILRNVARDDWWNYFKIIHAIAFTTTPTELWVKTYEEISAELERQLQKRELFIPYEVADKEMLWGNLLLLCNYNPQTTEYIRVDHALKEIVRYEDIETSHKHGWPLDIKFLRNKLRALKYSNVEVVPSPYGFLRKSKDRNQELTPEEANMLLTRSKVVLETAFSIYKAMIENYFPQLMDRVNIYQLLPIKLYGKIFASNSWSGPSTQIHYAIMPVEPTESTSIDLTFDNKWKWYDEDVSEAAYKTVKKLDQLRPQSYSWLQMPIMHGPLDLFGHFPSFEWAYKMLSWDLIELGVVKKRYETQSEQNSRRLGSTSYSN